MRSFIAFFKKEFLESFRSGKLILLGILFFAFGVMNPAIAKLTPWIIEILSEDLAQSGMTVTSVTVDALTSWTQFFKNIPMALIAFILIYSSIFTKEYEAGTLVLMLTKGVLRYKVLFAKSSLVMLLWTSGYWLCFAVTYGYNAYFWDNSVATGLMTATVNWWLFGIFALSLTILFSVISKNYSGVLLGTGAVVLSSYLLGLLPKISKYAPTALMKSSLLLIGQESAENYIEAVVVTVLLIIFCISVSIPVFNKKQL